MGAMPATGQWVRLDIAELAAGLRGVNLSGMAFTLDNGRATWDYTGKAALVPVDSNGYGIPDYLEDVNGNGTLSPGNVTLNWQTPDGGLIGTAAIQVFGRGPVPGGSSTGRSCRRPQP
jgi:hypothetical protein